MSAAYTTAGWENFFVAQVSASAALLGLIFVAASINLTKMLEVPSLPGRAFEAMAILAMVLSTATLGLVPGQPIGLLGAEMLAIALLAWAAVIFIQWRTSRNWPLKKKKWTVVRAVAAQLATLPMVVSGASLALQRGGGLYWAVLSVIASFLAALMVAWILLIEIHR